MYFHTFYKDQKEQIAGCIALDNEGEIRTGRSACHCACNCTCACACFCSCFVHELDEDGQNLTNGNYLAEEYLTKKLQS